MTAQQPPASCNNCYDKKCGYASDIPCGEWKYEGVEITQIREQKKREQISEINRLIRSNSSVTAQQESELLDRPFFCDDDCLSCDADTYIRCNVRLHPEQYKEIPNVR
jgi:hypothetical protein